MADLEGEMRPLARGIALGLMVARTAAAFAGSSVPEPAQDIPGQIRQSGPVCALTDDALAAEALKGPVKRDAPSGLPGLCSWRSLRTAGDALTVQIDAGGDDKFDLDHAKLRVRDLQGVGDRAFAFVSPAGFVQVGMMRAGTYVTLVLMLQQGTDRLERATALAKAIAQRMGG